MLNNNHAPPPWFEPHCPRNKLPPVRKTIYRNSKLLYSQFLPIISVSNMRSLMPKIKNVKLDVMERKIGLALLSEIWEKNGNKKHKFEIEKMLQQDGLKYISTPRPSSKRGGGCAIVADLKHFSLQKVDVIIPQSVEVTYGILRAKDTKAKYKVIIVVAFYSPPRSRKRSELLDNIITNCQVLMTKYPNAVLVIGGDRNEMSISPLLDSLPKMRQIVTKNTCNGKVLDVLLISIPELYLVPLIVPPVAADDPNQGSPSDHSTVLAPPLSQSGLDQNINEYSVKYVRPLPESGIKEFGQWITAEKWDNIKENDLPDKQVGMLQETLSRKLDGIFPTKKVKVSVNKDKPYITAELKVLDRLKMREYEKHGKSGKYHEIKSKFDEKLGKAANDHLEKNYRDLKASDPGRAYSTLKKMGAQPGDMLEEGSFTLVNHIEDNLTKKESVERIANHFSKISQEFPPISKDNLSERVEVKLGLKVDETIIPKLDEMNVFEKPSIIRSGILPSCWKVEFGIPLQKVENPENEDHLRIISLTPFFSKVFEKFVMEWLLEFIGPHINWGQHGWLKGSSVTLSYRLN